jgi:enamine deaminase RidA (YjgF/YER057c/UK114 family)
MAKRQSFQIEGSRHGAPIPMASKVGNILMSSAISGQGETPEEVAESMFNNIRAVMKAAGGTPDDIVKMIVLMQDNDVRKYIDTEWLKMFPDENSRPARHAEIPNRLAQKFFAVEITAVID